MPMQPIGGPLQFDQGPLGAPLSMPAPAPKKRSGMFGSGVGAGDLIQALLAGALAARGNPAGIAGVQMLNQRRHDKDEESQYQRHRQDALADYAEQQKLQQMYGPAAAPHYFETNSGDQMMIGPDGKPTEVFHDPMRYKFVPNGMGGVVPVDISSLMSGQAPTKPVGRLTPINEGGPMPQASGGFPRSF